jgi:hypothetical protein
MPKMSVPPGNSRTMLTSNAPEGSSLGNECLGDDAIVVKPTTHFELPLELVRGSSSGAEESRRSGSLSVTVGLEGIKPSS